MYWRASSSVRVSSSAPGARRSDQRPAPTGPPARRDQRACQRARALPRLCVAEMSARRPAKPSPVTRPAETSSQSASSTSARRRPAPPTISSRKLAPDVSRKRRTSRAGAESAASGAASTSAPSGTRSHGKAVRRPAGRARAKGAPGPPPGEAERVGQGGGVGGDARRGDLAPPGAARALEARELRDDLQTPAATVELRARARVLPREQKAHDV